MRHIPWSPFDNLTAQSTVEDLQRKRLKLQAQQAERMKKSTDPTRIHNFRVGEVVTIDIPEKLRVKFGPKNIICVIVEILRREQSRIQLRLATAKWVIDTVDGPSDGALCVKAKPASYGLADALLFWTTLPKANISTIVTNINQCSLASSSPGPVSGCECLGKCATTKCICKQSGALCTSKCHHGKGKICCNMAE